MFWLRARAAVHTHGACSLIVPLQENAHGHDAIRPTRQGPRLPQCGGHPWRRELTVLPHPEGSALNECVEHLLVVPE